MITQSLQGSRAWLFHQRQTLEVEIRRVGCRMISKSSNFFLFHSSKELHNSFGGGRVEEGVNNNLFIFKDSGKVL